MTSLNRTILLELRIVINSKNISLSVWRQSLPTLGKFT